MKSILIAFLFLFSTQTFATPLAIHSDSGIDGPPYEQIVRDLEDLNALYPNQTQLVNIGTTVQGRDTVGIMIYGASKNAQVNKTISITGATHGNEYVGIVNRLAPELLNPKNTEFAKYLNEGGAFFVLPILNPDGYVADRRYNKNGQDLNRDFPLEPKGMKGLSQPEVRNVVDFVEQWLLMTGSTLEIAMDYHCCYGGLLYPYAYSGKVRMPQADLDRHVELAEMMLSEFPNYKHGITGEVLGYYPAGTSKDYWYLQYGTRSYTFEGERYNEVEKLDQHIRWWKNMLSTLSLSKFSAI